MVQQTKLITPSIWNDDDVEITLPERQKNYQNLKPLKHLA
jgi:hypothetical protein